MKFNIIDLEKWPRKTHFGFYTQEGKSAYNLTANIDVTKLMAFLKKENYKFYPTFIYIVSKAINKIENLKIRVDDSGKLGYWDYISPTYTIFHDDDKTFSCIYTEYNADFRLFYKEVILDLNEYKNKKGFCPKPSPKNCFHTSCIPWLTYTGLSLHLYNIT
jgi:chloramphenicol O-acetyltransferase type A